MKTMMRNWRRFGRDESGVAATEYVVVLVIFTLGLALAVVSMRDVIGGVWDNSDNYHTSGTAIAPTVPTSFPGDDE